jgi:hypothetical protein
VEYFGNASLPEGFAVQTKLPTKLGTITNKTKQTNKQTKKQCPRNKIKVLHRK